MVRLQWYLFFCLRSQTVFESNRDATRVLQRERGEAYLSGYFKWGEIYALLGLRLTDKKSDKTFRFILGGIIAGLIYQTNEVVTYKGRATRVFALRTM